MSCSAMAEHSVASPVPESRLVVMNSADCNIDFEISRDDGRQCSTLSAGGFAYCWSGARATLGIRLDDQVDPPHVRDGSSAQLATQSSAGRGDAISSTMGTEQGQVPTLPLAEDLADEPGRRFYFCCRMVGPTPVAATQMADTPEAMLHLCRVGFSVEPSDVGALGEEPWSFGYEASGKKATDGQFADYGGPFSFGDSIACMLDLDARTISFACNGTPLGTAFTLPGTPVPQESQLRDRESGGAPALEHHGCPAHAQERRALFPHVLLKNVRVEVLLSREDGLQPMLGCLPWADALQHGCSCWGPRCSPGRGDGEVQKEVLMLVGLPGSGKSTWAQRWAKEHPEKRYVVLGTDPILDRMKVPGLASDKGSYGERWDALMPLASDVFNKLLERGPRFPRNFILDQTNVYPSARARKMRGFQGFRKVAVVVVPDEGVLQDRTRERAQVTGKAVPQDAVDEMKANFVLPQTRLEAACSGGAPEPFDEVWFVDLPREAAAAQVERYRAQGRAAKQGSSRNQGHHLVPRAHQQSGPRPRLAHHSGQFGRGGSHLGYGGRGRSDSGWEGGDKADHHQSGPRPRLAHHSGQNGRRGSHLGYDGRGRNHRGWQGGYNYPNPQWAGAPPAYQGHQPPRGIAPQVPHPSYPGAPLSGPGAPLVQAPPLMELNPHMPTSGPNTGRPSHGQR